MLVSGTCIHYIFYSFLLQHPSAAQTRSLLRMPPNAPTPVTTLKLRKTVMRSRRWDVCVKKIMCSLASIVFPRKSVDVLSRIATTRFASILVGLSKMLYLCRLNFRCYFMRACMYGRTNCLLCAVTTYNQSL